MLEVQGYIVCIIATTLVIFGLYRKHSKFCYFVMFAFVMALVIMVQDSRDISMYRYSYVGLHPHGKEPLFDAIQFYFRGKRWSFEAFKNLWNIITFVLLYRGIKKYADVPSAVLAVAIISPLTSFITQMRSAMVGAIALNAFSLVLSGRKRDKIAYAILILLSAQIHSIGYLFLIFLLISPNQKRTFESAYYKVILVVTLIAILFSANSIQIASNILKILPLPSALGLRAIGYFSGEYNSLRYSIFLALKHLFYYQLTERACSELILHGDLEELEKEKYRMIQEFNNFALIFLPITILSASFERSFYWIMLLQYATVFRLGSKKIKFFKRVKLVNDFRVLLVTVTLVMLIVEIYFSPDDLVNILNSVSLKL